MARIAISVPEILVNDEKIEIVPNSFSYTRGEPEINVRSASGGGDSAQTVHTVDGESMISEPAFSMYVTTQTDRLITRWKKNVGRNVIKVIQSSGGENITITFPGQSLTNKPSLEASADGTVELEFKGDRAI